MNILSNFVEIKCSHFKPPLIQLIVSAKDVVDSRRHLFRFDRTKQRHLFRFRANFRYFSTVAHVGWYTALVKKSKVGALLIICYQSTYVLSQTSRTASAAVFVKEDILFNIIQAIIYSRAHSSID